MAKRRALRPWGTAFRLRGRIVVRFRAGGRRYQRPGGETLDLARKRLRDLRTLVENGTPVPEALATVFGDFAGTRLTFREAVEHYMKDAEVRKKRTTIESDESRFRVLSKAPWAGEYLANVKPGAINAWAESRRAAGVSGATVNRDLNLASALYSWAIGREYVEENPFRGPRVKRFKESRGREVYLTADEANALIGACSPTLRPFALAAVHTGMRRGELLALRWRSVDLKRREVRIEAETEKTGRGRVVKMTTALHSALADLKASRSLPALDGSDRVFSRPDGEPLGDQDVRAVVATARKCEGIALEKRDAVRFHDLRHTAASLMVAAGVPLFDVAKVLGHSTLAVTMRYAHFAPEAGAAAAESLGAALAGRMRASV